jgi:prepilin-type N-terminal cleavage/methylation domain-containing protein
VKNKKGFTLIEVMLISVIIAILASAVLVSMNQSRKNARINSVKAAFKNSLPAIVYCIESGGTINAPSNPETGAKLICNSIAGAYWPVLNWGYLYVAGGTYTSNCSFQISTNGDSASNLTCTCLNQNCQ